ncbi:hypothetical protein AX16_009898 [Volvariella volvacea WC 439]|nr:hypothetical protein AX16_009898 [Volvariella volvacea WC 439]
MSSTEFKIRQVVATEEQKKTLQGLTSIPEVQALEPLLATAFSEPPDAFSAVVIGQKTLEEKSPILGPFWATTVTAGLLGGEVHVAETNDAEKKIVGCAVWFPPGRSLYDSADQQELSLGPLMALFDPPLQEWWQRSFLPVYDRFTSSAFGEGVKHNSWHLQTLGVLPEYRKRGVSAALIEIVAQKAKQTKHALVLECEKDINVDIYGRLSFKPMIPSYKTIENPNPEKYDYAITVTSMHGNLEFPMWALRRDVS